jgi:hypothetical protein
MLKLSSKLHPTPFFPCALPLRVPLQLYRALVQSRSCNVKKTLACSLHEVARILSTTEEVPGPNCGFGSESPAGYEDQDQDHDQGYNEYFMDGVTLVERELIPVFESMLQVSCVDRNIYFS